jgi:hypothetical protein
MPLGEGINPCSVSTCKDVGHAEPTGRGLGCGILAAEVRPTTLTLPLARRVSESAHRGRHKTVTRTRLAMRSCSGPLSPSTIMLTNDPLPHDPTDAVHVLLRGDRRRPECSR